MSIKITNPDAYATGNPALANGSFEFYLTGTDVRAYAGLAPNMAQRAPFANALSGQGLPVDHLWVDNPAALDVVFRDRAGAETDRGALVDNLSVLNPSAGGGGGEVTSADITDSTAVGRDVLTAEDAEAARTAIGAGTSNLALGSGATEAAAGDHTHEISGVTGLQDALDGKASSTDLTTLEGRVSALELAAG